MVDSTGVSGRRVVVFIAVAILLLLSLLPSKPAQTSAVQSLSKDKNVPSTVQPSKAAHPAKVKPASSTSKAATPKVADPTDQQQQHPIDKLIQNAKAHEDYFLSRQTSGLDAAAEAYRTRRGRHPPPTFDRWYKWAMDHDVLMVEDFFDTLYDDLEPFWNVSAKLIREFPRSWSDVLSIRDGKIHHWADEPANIADWMNFYDNGWSLLPLQDIPDVDLAFNAQDEPKLFVPWDIKHKHLEEALAVKAANPPTAGRKPSVTEFVKRDPLTVKRPPPNERTHFNFMDYPFEKNLWHACYEACSPDSKAHEEGHADLEYSIRPQWPTDLPHMYEGFVANWTSAKSACENPHLRGLHGSFIAMQAQHNDHKHDQKALIGTMVPLLSGSKIRDINSEILIPAAMHWPNKVGVDGFNFGGKDAPGAWSKKINKFMWRGVASGGVNNKDNWTRFQRHRFVAMANASLVGEHQKLVDPTNETPLKTAQEASSLPHNFPLPDPKTYNLSVLQSANPSAAIKAWLEPLMDVAFVHLRCWPAISWFGGNGADCPYNKEYYEVKKSVPSADQLKYKYLPDIDGATFSGRYRAFLVSDSLPIKATIYDEWHDSRLVPWRHFVPMDNTFQDFWGILQYFLGYRSKPEAPAHDEVAREIADGGSEWARNVLRQDDMVAYIYRLTLELARLQDERREDMGWADDL